MTTAKQCRWRPQFSLRFLLVATVAVAVVLGWLASEVRQASRLQTTVAELNATGADVEFGSVSILGVELDDAWASWLAQLPMGEALFRDVVAISVSEGSEGEDPDKAIELASSVDGIKEVECFFVNLTSESVTRLSQFPALQKLQLRGCSLPEGESVGLSRFESLTELSLHGEEVTDELLSDALRLERLETLELYGCDDLSPEVIQQIGNCATLRRLRIDACISVFDEDVMFLSKLSRLEELSLSQTSISDDACVQVSKLKNMHNLSLAATNVSDRGIEQLTQLTDKLSTFDIHSTEVSDDGIRRLVSPACIRELVSVHGLG